MMADDSVDDLFAELEEVFAGVVEEDLTTLPTPKLLEILYEVGDELKEMGELLADTELHPNHSTQRGRDLHAKRAACIIELRNRGIR